MLESKIPLGDVSGRIDHFAIDSARQRLFVAELGNNTLGVVDLDTPQVSGQLAAGHNRWAEVPRCSRPVG